jgi:putative transposase
MSDQRRGSHTVTRLTVHLVWVTKYRYPVLKGEVQKRCRELIMQICDAEDVKILKGVVSKDHVHMHIEYPPSQSVSELMRRI